LFQHRTERRVVTLDLQIFHPTSIGFSGGPCGPFVGTHALGEPWYMHWGSGLGAAGGTDVVAPVDPHMTMAVLHDLAVETPRVCGAQLLLRAPNDAMGAFSTHLTDVPAEITAVTTITRGQRLGGVFNKRNGWRFTPGAEARLGAGIWVQRTWWRGLMRRLSGCLRLLLDRPSSTSSSRNLIEVCVAVAERSVLRASDVIGRGITVRGARPGSRGGDGRCLIGSYRCSRNSL